jgi:type I restriction enzyme S subunit
MSGFVLPHGWVSGTLSDFVQPRSEKVLPSTMPDAPFLGMEHIEAHSTRIIGRSKAADLKSSAVRFYNGDVLYGRLRPYLNKVASPSFDGLASAEFIVFPDSDLVRNSFLKYRLNATDFVNFACHLNEGDRPRVAFDQIGAFPMSLPSPAEQSRIVAKVEELLSELEKGIEALTSARDLLKAYRQSVLRHALEGKLTEDWRKRTMPEEQFPCVLLDRLNVARDGYYAEQLRLWQVALREWEADSGKGKRPPKPEKPAPIRPVLEDETARLPLFPKRWECVRLATIAQIGSGMSVSKDRALENAIEVPYLRVANVQRGKLDLTHVTKMKVEKSQLPQLTLKKWDVLFNEGGDRDKLGRGWVWESQIVPCITQNHVFRASPYLATELHAKFISYWGNTFGQDYFNAEGKQTTNLASINKAVLSSFPVPLPSMQEQAEIVQQIEALCSRTDQMQSDIETELARANALRQSILKQAFSGQLIAQDPNDEPAAVLLERIRAEQEAAQKAKKERNGKRRMSATKKATA